MESHAERLNVLSAAMHRCTGKVPVNGVDIFYEKVGTGPKPVLLLPGVFGSGATDFGPQLKGLDSKKFTLIAWDPRGFGKSIPPRRDFPVDYLRRDANDASVLMEKLGYEKYSLVGWSDGGNTAAIVACTHPDRVERLVIWGCNAYIRKEDCDDWESIRDVTTWSKNLRGPLENIYGAKDLQILWHECLDATLKLLEEHDGEIFSKDLKFIQAKTLILHGMKDVVAPYFHAKFIHDNIKGSILECWPEGKHNLHLRFADRFNERVNSFLSGE